MQVQEVAGDEGLSMNEFILGRIEAGEGQPPAIRETKPAGAAREGGSTVGNEEVPEIVHEAKGDTLGSAEHDRSACTTFGCPQCR